MVVIVCVGNQYHGYHGNRIERPPGLWEQSPLREPNSPCHIRIGSRDPGLHGDDRLLLGDMVSASLVVTDDALKVL